MGIFERRDRRHAERTGRLAAGRPEPADEKLRVGTYFVATGSSVRHIYGRCTQVVNREVIIARCYSQACVDGESGSFPVERILRFLSKEEFATARRDGWP